MAALIFLRGLYGYVSVHMHTISALKGSCVLKSNKQSSILRSDETCLLHISSVATAVVV